MMNYLLVFLGGGLGSICRFGLHQWLTPVRISFPWATFAANALACLLLGAFAGWTLRGKLTEPAMIFLSAGFCGGFSTFSTFTYEFFQLLTAGQYVKAAVYLTGSLLVCLICLLAGWRLAV